MNVRGILPSLGAGGSLTAAVLCAAAVVGGGLAFRGEAGGSAEPNTGDVTLPDATGHARTRSSPPPHTLARQTTARGAPAATPRRLTTRATAPRPGALPRATITPRPTVPPAPAPRPGAPTPPVVPKPPAGVRQTVQHVRQVVQPVVDALPEPVRGPVEHATDAVDQTVDGLLP